MKAKKKKTAKRWRCGHCRKVATWKIKWADGRAIWPVCDSHKALGLRTIRKNGKWACIVGVVKA